ncbi:MAG: hypothetical protein U9O83_02645 [Campylobacterota bacterium]|nr:hypothetical protein [Campylobacterota bacterium]
MTPESLHRPFIGITLYVDDYIKVKGLLPTPSYTDTLHSYFNKKIILIYVIEGYITSHNQFRWISNIRLGLEQYLCVPFDFEEEFIITEHTEITNSIYQIDELSKAFNAPLIIYPKIMYPSNKKELYKYLCWYGKRLIHQKCFTKEAITSTALLMNEKIDDKYQSKELHKKALGAYIYIDENREGFSIGLDEVQLKEAHSKGAMTKNQNQAEKTKERLQKLLKSGDFIKANGKVNLSLLSKAMNMTRKTVAKYV